MVFWPRIKLVAACAVGALVAGGAVTPTAMRAMAAEEGATVEGLTVSAVRPIVNLRNVANRILPTTASIPANLAADAMEIAACPGEYEPASFVVRATSAVEGLTVGCTDLKAEEDVIPSSAVDIRVVKCWYQAGYAAIGHGGGPAEMARRVLIPELLLKDDALVRADTTEKANYLKVAYRDGEEHVKISTDAAETKAFLEKSNGVEAGTRFVIPVEALPVKDSPVLLPVSIPAGTSKQFWVTVHVPGDTQPGNYAGSIELKHGEERIVGGLSLTVTVLPIELSEPYYTSSIYYRGRLHPDWPNGSISSEYKSKEQVKAELENMLAHGVTNPAFASLFTEDETLAGDFLAIRSEVGLDTDPLYIRTWDIGAVARGNRPVEWLKENVRKRMELARQYGAQEVYFYGVDEARGEVLQAERKAFAAVHEAGGKVFVAGYTAEQHPPGNFEVVGGLLDILICAGSVSREEAAKWHGVGHKIWSYANPQGGFENMERYRRNFGLLLWRNGYDGACTYAYQDGVASAWSDHDSDQYRDHNFTYPTVDGVIDTLAWEGYREGVDDVRYVTTLEHAIEEAKKAGNREAVALAAERFLDGLEVAESGYGDMADGNLDAIRAQMISHILRLSGIEVAEPEPEEPEETEPAETAGGLEQGLVGYWSFDEGAGAEATDGSGNGNDGALKGGVEWVPGKSGAAVRFTEGSYVQVEKSDSLVIPKQITMALWVYPEERFEGYRFLALCQTGGVPPYGMLLEDSLAAVPVIGVGGKRQSLWSRARLPVAAWTHLAFTYDGDTGAMEIYVNGELDTSGTKSPGTVDAPVGALVFSLKGRTFPGRIDEVRIWDRVLSADQVTQCMGSAQDTAK